jgi:hypothetical protein
MFETEIPSGSTFIENAVYTAVGIRHVDHVAPSIRKRWY